MAQPISPFVTVPGVQADAINVINTYKKVLTNRLQG
jgi:hypothetical protein